MRVWVTARPAHVARCATLGHPAPRAWLMRMDPAMLMPKNRAKLRGRGGRLEGGWWSPWPQRRQHGGGWPQAVGSRQRCWRLGGPDNPACVRARTVQPIQKAVAQVVLMLHQARPRALRSRDGAGQLEHPHGGHRQLGVPEPPRHDEQELKRPPPAQAARPARRQHCWVGPLQHAGLGRRACSRRAGHGGATQRRGMRLLSQPA